jgi:hypothetical protein
METRTRYGSLSGSGMNQLILVGGLALIAYFILQSLAKKGAEAAAAATRAVTAPVVNPLAEFYVYLTSQGVMIPQGVVLMPNGDAVPVANLNVRSVPGTNSATFQYQGGTYYINGPHDANGNWAASTTLGS